MHASALCAETFALPRSPDGPGRTLSEPKPASAPLVVQQQSQGHRLGGDPEKSPAVPAQAVLPGGEAGTTMQSDREKRAAEAAAAAERRQQKVR